MKDDGMKDSAVFDASWLLRSAGSYLAVCFIYGLITLLSGPIIAMICGLLFLAFALGLFYGAGSEIRKREEAQAIEARKDQDARRCGAKHESAVATGDAPEQGSHHG